MIKRFFKLCVVGLAVFALIQFVQPSIPTSPSLAEVHAPHEAVQVLNTSCYSCHSNERRLSWFDQIEPAYWLVRHDILTARSRLNFSTLGAKPAPAQRSALFEAVNMMQLNFMPLPQFVALHPDAKVDPAELEKLKSYLAPWADTPALQPSPTDLVAPSSTAPEYGGLAFDPTYTTWHLLSVTDRGDNNTFRFILGNDIATAAARTGRINPWPDGARFAKIAWQQRSAPDGTVQPGQFIQIEQMLKDSKGHKDSQGWAWGRWRGPKLTPYGTDATSVIAECTGCHAPMKKNDFVYTMPISAAHSDPADAINNTAASHLTVPFDPATAAPLTMLVDRKAGTMSVLYGNNSELLLITWRQTEDPHWFGARIPGAPVSDEYLHLGADSSTTQYRRLDEQSGHEASADPAFVSGRISFIGQLAKAPYLSH